MNQSIGNTWSEDTESVSPQTKHRKKGMKKMVASLNKIACPYRFYALNTEKANMDISDSTILLANEQNSENPQKWQTEWAISSIHEDVQLRKLNPQSSGLPTDDVFSNHHNLLEEKRSSIEKGGGSADSRGAFANTFPLKNPNGFSYISVPEEAKDEADNIDDATKPSPSTTHGSPPLPEVGRNVTTRDDDVVAIFPDKQDASSPEEAKSNADNNDDAIEICPDKQDASSPEEAKSNVDNGDDPATPLSFDEKKAVFSKASAPLPDRPISSPISKLSALLVLNDTNAMQEKQTSNTADNEILPSVVSKVLEGPPLLEKPEDGPLLEVWNYMERGVNAVEAALGLEDQENEVENLKPSKEGEAKQKIITIETEKARIRFLDSVAR